MFDTIELCRPVLEPMPGSTDGLTAGECRVIHIGPDGELGHDFVDCIWKAMAEHGEKLEGTVSSRDRHIMIVAPGTITLISFGPGDAPTQVLHTPVFPW